MENFVENALKTCGKVENLILLTKSSCGKVKNLVENLFKC
nr:MAG TPA: hypothetical protein [Caudoviricetes sp.]